MLVFFLLIILLFFFFNDTATTEIYTLSLHDALPISDVGMLAGQPARDAHVLLAREVDVEDRKSTRLNSSHSSISYAVFCLKKKKKRRHLPHAMTAQRARPSHPAAALALHSHAASYCL